MTDRDKLLDAFKRAEYKIITPFGFDVVVQVGPFNGDAAYMMAAMGVETVSIITPHNPNSEILSEKENQDRLKRMWRIVYDNLVCAMPAVGYCVTPGEDWPQEIGIALFNISDRQAHKFAHMYGQIAWLKVVSSGDAEVIETQEIPNDG